MVLSRLLSIATLSALLGVSLGCAPGNPGMDVLGTAPPDPGNMCRTDPLTLIFEGNLSFDLDPRYAPSFTSALVVQNHLLNRFSMSFPVMANQNDIVVSGIEVELLDRNGRRLAIPNPFYRGLASGTIPSGRGDQPGRGLAFAEIIPPAVANQLPALFADAPAGSASIVARVAVIGSTQGGSEVIANDFVIPIRLCVGCLYRPGPPDDGEEEGCRPGQDVTMAQLAPLPPCETGETCPSDFCVLGRCLP